MSDCTSDTIPVVTLNDDIRDFPLTTEEPLNNDELEKEIESINHVNPEDDQVPAAVILDKQEPNKLVLTNSNISDDELTLLDEDDKPQIIIDGLDTTTTTKKSPPPSPVSKSLSSNFAPATTSITTTTATGALVISAINMIPKQDSDSDETDDELIRITEANRFIPIEKKDIDIKNRDKSLKSRSVTLRRDLLVFTQKPTVIKKLDRIVVQQRYGAGLSGKLDQELQPKRRSRGYLVACDFSEESFHAIEWTMGTMMRDGDVLHVVTVVNREDNPEAVKETGLSLSKELQKASDTVTEEAKKTMSQMLLFDVELITYTICGRVKDVLCNLIDELTLTMVVCGSRGRGTVKGLLMGSISTYLVHKSSVPVTVIRPQKKKKTARKRPLHTAPLTQSVKSGHLAVDELSKPTNKSTQEE
ncbi:hypothetical protein BDF21DRAFT_460187 [Thamnidium elegans]|uniref:UspA domain-containing protein n=1 Tax=Thamnidium elegans TaxID=101142 RepID=A0A8H7SPT2_9FUNG|nr:hypothetical protein INT48_006170 [Thamnidium elegans]KAI8090762.1 hypothetical protein BDF21DRAFT_460187 [Thamnidium elegans]